MTKDEALTLEALKYAASMGYPSSMLKDRFAPFTIKEAQAQPEQEPGVLHEAVISAWSLREVYFDEDGEPSMHRSPQPRPWVGLTEQDMPSGEDPMFDHEYFFAGMVYASTLLKEKNT